MRALLGRLTYPIIRKLFINYTKDLETAIDQGDKVLIQLHRSLLSNPLFKFKTPKGIGVHLHGLYFQSPLLFASFKGELDILNSWLDLGMGGGCCKTILKDERKGNKKPRIEEAIINEKHSLINAMGLPGPGVDAFLKTLLAHPILSRKQPIGISLGGESIQEYYDVAKTAIKKTETLHNLYLELNISCPNTDTGRSLEANPEELEKFILWIRSQTDKALSIKISPDLDNNDILQVVEIIRPISKTIINAGNTTFRKSKNLSRGGGGLSGPTLFPRTLEMATLLKPTKIPVISTGGISNIHHIKALKEQNVQLFGMATAIIKNPYNIPLLNKKLKKL